MAKKVRGKSSTYRPGRQGRSRSRESASPAGGSASPTGSNSSDAIDTAIDSAGESFAIEPTQVSLAASAPVVRKPKAERRSARAKAESLEGRATAEEAWVREDLRHIAVISAVLFVGLAVAWVVFVLMNVVDIY